MNPFQGKMSKSISLYFNRCLLETPCRNQKWNYSRSESVGFMGLLVKTFGDKGTSGTSVSPHMWG